MLRLSFDPFKILLNALQYLVGFTFTKALGEPDRRVFVSFARITTYARWQNVIARVFASSIYWNEMFLMQHTMRIPQARWIAAICANAMKIFKGTAPVGLRECRSERTSLRTVVVSSNAIWRRINTVAFASSEFNYFAVVCGVFIGAFFSLVGIVRRVALFAFSGFFRMLIAPLANMLAIANMAFISQSISFAAIFGELTCGLESTAFVATLIGVRDIQHGNLLKLSPSVVLSAGLGNPVVEWFMRPLQAQAQYTTEGTF